MPPRRATVIGLAVVISTCLELAGAPTAMARQTALAADDDARVERRCSRGSDAELRVRARGKEIRVELDIDVERPGGTWRVILLHERRTAYQGTLRPRDSQEIRLRRTVPNWFGTDAFTVRATAAGGETCRATVSI